MSNIVVKNCCGKVLLNELDNNSVDLIITDPPIHNFT